ncbi:MAG: response regulator [Elusimicrobia bacterium]|nr:response regulator [Elusimicrobiota bacterium]
MARILIIDDDAFARDALEVFRTRDGHKVLTAADGDSGARLFKRNAPDLVVLDKDLPGMTGPAALEEIRGSSGTVPVVLLSGRDAPGDAAKYLRSGATVFLSKKDGLLNALNEIDRLLGVKKRTPPPAAARPAPAPAPAAGSKGLVLVADDDAALAGAASRFLASRGYEVLQAGDGGRAVELARARRPDAVVLDITMPGKDGVEVLRELAPELPGTGFIMLSGNEDGNVAPACLKIGASNYLNKPADLVLLESLISRLLSRRAR